VSINKVGTTDEEEILAEVETVEAEIFDGKGTVNVEELRSELDNVLVETGFATVEEQQVICEDIESTSQLLDEEGLSLNFANLFKNHLLSEFLNDEQLLLNKVNGLSSTEQLILKEELLVLESEDIVDAEEIVEAIKRCKASPTVEVESSVTALKRKRSRDNTSSQNSAQSELNSSLKMHVDCQKK